MGLADILLLPGLNTIVDLDHELLWSWCGELLLGGTEAPFASCSVNREIRELATTTVRAALANVRPPTRDAFERAGEAARLMEPNAREYLSRTHNTLPYLAFPLLEAVARRACSAYVDLNGKVTTPFPRYAGKSYVVNARCNNVADLLRLLVETVGSPALKADLSDVLSHIGELGSVERETQGDGYAVIFDWRNSSLHGETSLSTIGGTVLTVALLIALDSIQDQYAAHRAAALDRARREVESSEFSGQWNPSPWSYYPPFHVPRSAQPQGPPQAAS